MTALKVAIVRSSTSQYRIAQVAGMSETRLSRLATGRVSPSHDELRRLAAALGCTVSDLLESGVSKESLEAK